jgi:hypothetical protein
MTDLRDAALRALASLKGYRRELGCQQPCDAERALEAALEQPEQEPVAWMYKGIKSDGTEHGPHLVWVPAYMDAMSAEKGAVASPLYTHPPRREWRSLNEEEIWRAIKSCGTAYGLEVNSIARAIEAALRSKNHE